MMRNSGKWNKAHILWAFLLCGCGHNAYFISRSTGATGTAHVPAMSRGGPVDVTLAGKTYHGRWIFMDSGGAVTMGTATATSGFRSATVFGSAFSFPTGGNGSLTAVGPDGRVLRCAFDFSQWSNTGIGLCSDSKGEIYDLQIN